MPRQVVEKFSIAKAAELAQLSVPMLDYLCRTDVVVPSITGKRGRGRARYYSFGDVVILRAVARLLENGISVHHLRRGLKNLRRHHPEFSPTQVPTRLLVTDGASLLLRERADVVEDLNKGQLAFGFIVELAAVHKEVITRERSRAGSRPRKRA
jgi:DNA-binding transcriptional MerR regulator